MNKVPPRTDPEFGPKLKTIRQNAGLSRASLAFKIGCSPQSISSWEEQRVMRGKITLPQQRFYDRIIAVLERGELPSFERKQFVSSHVQSAPQAYITPQGLDLKHVTESDLVRELKRRGYKVTLEM